MNRLAALALVAVVASGCGAPAATPSASSTNGPSAAPTSEPSAAAAGGIALDPLTGASAVRHPQAGIAAAFDAAGAAALVDPVPQVDFSRQGIVCVFLGQRTGSWTLDLQSARLSGGALELLGRERPPRGGDTKTTYPAGCALLGRAGLPAGTIAVTAHDTVADEFITQGQIEVPAS